ncbi:MAG: alpha/beta hydrolase [Gemmatimonadales bacterium]|nr:alpha/beta hydrolase [Gemmatimonadales bacterium]
MNASALAILRSVLLTVCFLCAGTVAQADVGDQTGAAPEVEEHLVDAGSYKLHFRIIRGQGPVVLLEAGGGMDSAEWNDLAPRIAQVTGATVVSYDRPGFGKSDLPEIPCDMREESSSMWRALGHLELDENVVLVGHSYGGWMVRLHANDHPDDVVGLVFVDPFNSTFVDSYGVEYCDQHPMMGKLPFDISQPEKLTREQKALARMVGQGLGPKVELMRETRIKEGIPVRLITSTQPFLPKAEEQEAWRLAHEKVVDSIPGAVLVEAKESGHMIPWQQPDLVLEEIRKVVEAVRGS